MIDLVKRLRTMAATGWNPIGDEAADEITCLRAEVERLKEWNREIALNAREFVAENERLRAALEEIAYPNPDHGEDQLMQIARAALEEKR